MDSTNNTENRDVRCYNDEVCINARKIYDTCKDKDCLSDMRVYLSADDQALVEEAVNIRARSSELVWTNVSVEEVPFNKGFYSVDMIFYFRTGFEVYTGNSRPAIIEGLSIDNICNPNRNRNNLPIAEVEVVDPIILNAKIVTPSCNCHCSDYESPSIPDYIASLFCDELTELANRRLILSLGLFSVVRLVRDVQIRIPSAKFSLPEKECQGPCEEEPCSFFEKLGFPTNEFFPPEQCDC